MHYMHFMYSSLIHFKMASQPSNKKCVPSSLTKKQVKGIVINIEDHCNRNINEIESKITEDISNDITMQTPSRMTLISVLLTLPLITHFCESFCDMYCKGSIGRFKDKYSLLQIRWSEWIWICFTMRIKY